jgi:hypothetical protein
MMGGGGGSTSVKDVRSILLLTHIQSAHVHEAIPKSTVSISCQILEVMTWHRPFAITTP